MNPHPGRGRRGLLAVIVATALPTSAVAQTTASTPPTGNENSGAVRMEPYIVTGSYIPAAADEARAMPVIVLDLPQILKTGVNTNVLDVLRKTVPQIQGYNNVGVENGNFMAGYNNGGSAVALRDLETLVLVDGKRVAISPVGALTSAKFVDLNLIPLSAIQRIEVLTDGASAIYGTDAVSGVVNIILRQDYSGMEVNAHYTAAPKDTSGYWLERSVGVTAGGGNVRTHLMVAAEWTKSQPLWERDVASDQTGYGTANYPGVINDSLGNFYRLAPGLNAPENSTRTSLANLVAQGVYVPSDDVALGFNVCERPTVMNALEKRILLVSGSHAMSKSVTLKGDFLYANTETRTELNPQPVSSPNGPLVDAGVSPITDTDVTVRNRFLDGPNRIYDNVNHFYRITAELDGTVSDRAHWQIYANYNLSRQAARGFNQILDSALISGMQDGLINLFAIHQDPAGMAQAGVYGTSIGNYRSELWSLDALVEGRVLDLPGGPLQFAAGVEYRQERLTATADSNSMIPPGGDTSRWNNGPVINPFEGTSNVTSEFAELRVPVLAPKNGVPGLHLLSLDTALRHESYSVGDQVTVPKVSVRYLPFNDELALRATYAKSFSVPPLLALHGPSGYEPTFPLGGLDAYASNGVPTGANFPNLQAWTWNGSNPDLKPSRAQGRTLGFIWSPRIAHGLELTVDYYRIDQKDLVGALASELGMIQSVEQYGPASPFAPYVALGGFPGRGGRPVTAPGQLSPDPTNVYVKGTSANIGRLEQQGWDLSFHYALPWKRCGRIVINSQWAILQRFFVVSGPTDPGTEYSGHDDAGTLPKARSYTTLDWDYRGLGATLGYTHIPHVDNYWGDWIRPYNTFDLQVRIDLGRFIPRLKGLGFDVGVNNFTNQKPPLDRTLYMDPSFDAGTYGFFGRIFYADMRYKF